LWKLDLWLMPTPKVERKPLLSEEPENVVRNKLLRRLHKKLGTTQ